MQQELRQRVAQKPLVFIGQSPVAQQVLQFTEAAAQSDHTILLRGESGVGKDLVAEMVHRRGKPARPFVFVDCGALPPTLSETELFGHAPGAFTDGKSQKLGLLTVASEGSIFFNEIANMGLDVQAKFLSVVERRAFRPVGATRETEVTARFIAASNADLEAKVKQGEFRADLFHRLNVLSYEIPPLRARREDIPALVEHILSMETLKKTIAPEALAVMQEYHWPGNVRELMGTIRRAAFLAKGGEIGIEEIAPFLKGVGETGFPTYLELQRRYFREVIRYCRGNLVSAAEMTGLERRTLQGKLVRLQLLDFVEEIRGTRLD